MIIGFLDIHAPGQHELTAVVKALSPPRPGFGAKEHGQEQGGQNGDDGNDYEQFSQGKRAR
jgi:hypothetical protein